MRKQIGVDILGVTYSFNKTAKTVTLINLPFSLTLNKLLLINNATANIFIFDMSSGTKTATITNNVITLAYDTSSMVNTDILQIWVSIEDYEENLITLMNRFLMLIHPNAVVNKDKQQQMISESTPSAYPVTNITGFGPSINQNILVNPQQIAIDQYLIYYPNPDPDDPNNERNIYSTDWGFIFPPNDIYVFTPIQHTTVSRGPIDQRWEIINDSQIEYNTAIRNKLEWVI